MEIGIALVGVENWGAGRFKKAGDLEKSISKIEPNDFKILLSHDPSHWEAEVIPMPTLFISPSVGIPMAFSLVLRFLGG